MKKLLMIVAMATLATTAMAMPPDLKPPITTGNTGDSSNTEVRITANVVQGIAVNEASPIDFGNLARGMYTGIVNQNTPGRITIKGTPQDKVNVKLDKKETRLVWTGTNGTSDPNDSAATKTSIEGVKVHGLELTDTEFTLNATGEASQILTASFIAGTEEAANLGTKQKLGSYVGSVLVTATKK